MNYRLKSTGAIIDVVAYSSISTPSERRKDDYVRYMDFNGNVRHLGGVNIYIDCEPIEKRQVLYLSEQFRAEAAKDILCAMISSQRYLFGEGNVAKHVDTAIAFADMLIRKLGGND